MSMPINIERMCAICGKMSEQMVLASTNRFGPPDLDLRPPEMERSTMDWWIEECPHCGYVSPDLSEKTAITKEWLNNGQYISCDGRNFANTLAERFYKHYLISSANADNQAAFHAVLHAAWASDDAEDIVNAIYSRKKALELFPKLVFANDEEETYLLMRADLLRRTEQFDLLIKEYEGKIFSEELLCNIAIFQVEKAKKKDMTCYTLADVEKYAKEFEKDKKETHNNLKSSCLNGEN